MALPPARSRSAAALALACVVLAGCQSLRPEPPPDLTQAVRDFVAASQGRSGGDYRVPGARARSDLSEAVLAVADGRVDQAEDDIASHGYRLAATRRHLLVQPEELPDGKGWGLYAVRTAGLPVAVEVPHPRADRRTEHLGAELAERLDAQYLLVAGARRERDEGRADVAHQPDSLFAVVHGALAEQGVPAVQLHGFAEQSAPRFDAVVSPGRARVSALVEAVADGLADADLRTCRAWREECGPLAGRRNVQGTASAEAGADFVHLEVTWPVRQDPARRAELVDALAAAITSVVGPRPSG